MGDAYTMRKGLVSLFAVTVLLCFASAAHPDDWIFLGEAHVDGQHDHDNINLGGAAGRYRAIQLRIVNAPIEFDRIVVHYGNGEAEVLQVREVIRAGGHSRAIPLAGDRKIEKLELWYAKAKPNSRRPEIKVWGRH